MLKHIELSRKKTLEPKHFERWIELWQKTVDDHFQGPKAELAKVKADQISQLMMHKIHTDRMF